VIAEKFCVIFWLKVRMVISCIMRVNLRWRGEGLFSRFIGYVGDISLGYFIRGKHSNEFLKPSAAVWEQPLQVSAWLMWAGL
tara:strand:- start:24 stop:269 length:246 start_codon:yes stop_codon:yes gene_type:complete